VLWTNDPLVAARRIYLAAGFRLVNQQQHHSFGADLGGSELRVGSAPASGERTIGARLGSAVRRCWKS
jgi:hypothetical protein